MIDLNACEKGDILISSRGLELEYVCKTPWRHYTYLDHVVKYPKSFGEGKYGTRTNDGFVFAENRNPKTDHDIVKIIKKSWGRLMSKYECADDFALFVISETIKNIGPCLCKNGCESNIDYRTTRSLLVETIFYSVREKMLN